MDPLFYKPGQFFNRVLDFLIEPVTALSGCLEVANIVPGKERSGKVSSFLPGRFELGAFVPPQVQSGSCTGVAAIILTVVHRRSSRFPDRVGCTISAYRAWANGPWPFVVAVSAITFQSNTALAFATADPNRVAINVIVRGPGSLCRHASFSLCFLLILHWLSVSGDRHIRGNGGCCPYRRVCRGVMFCVALKTSVGCTCVSPLLMWCKITQLPWGVPWLPSQPEWSNRSGSARLEVDLRPRRLRRGSHVLKLERIPFAFSCSSSFKRFAWSTCRPPYSLRQRKYVCSTISASLHACAVVFPFAIATTIWLQLKPAED